jgi:hypothetical protein
MGWGKMLLEDIVKILKNEVTIDPRSHFWSKVEFLNCNG